MNWIKRIEIVSLWGAYDVSWQLEHQVSIIAGGNGTGKSTMLRSLACFLATGNIDKQHEELFDDLIVTFADNTAVSLRHGYNPTDRQNKVHANFLPFNLPEGITSDNKFCDTVDRLFTPGGKHIVRGNDTLTFEFTNGKQIKFDHLSSGEKEILRLFAAAWSSKQGDVLILDEPELSLHFDWQKSLITDLLSLSSAELQLIISTHSPAIVMQGWLSNISQIESLLSCR